MALNYQKDFDGGTNIQHGALFINSEDDVGIGTATPNTKLEINGEIKLGATGTPGVVAGPNAELICNSDTEGAQRYNRTIKNMEFCDGTNWHSVGTGYAQSGLYGTCQEVYAVGSPAAPLAPAYRAGNGAGSCRCSSGFTVTQTGLAAGPPIGYFSCYKD